jgi:hypothetical protein
MSSQNNINTGPTRGGGKDIVKIYEDKHSHYTILAVFEGYYVRWSREELGELEDEEVSTKEEFHKMIEEEGWRELYYNNKK